jgi:tripartite-type tricarboxylate transporter receptor subunit TctC
MQYRIQRLAAVAALAFAAQAALAVTDKPECIAPAEPGGG